MRVGCSFATNPASIQPDSRRPEIAPPGGKGRSEHAFRARIGRPSSSTAPKKAGLSLHCHCLAVSPCPMPTKAKFIQPVVYLGFTMVFNGRRLDIGVDGQEYFIEAYFSSRCPPLPHPGFDPESMWQLIARSKDGTARSHPFVPLSREFETREQLDAELQNGWMILSDNSQIDETRKRIIDVMLRMKAIEMIS